MYKFETKTNKDGEIENLINHEPNGYNPTTGIYASSFIFQGEWEDELGALDYTTREKEHDEVTKTDADKGIKTQYLYNAFRSPDGLETTTEMEGDFWKELAVDFNRVVECVQSTKTNAEDADNGFQVTRIIT